MRFDNISKTFSDISHIQTRHGEYQGIFYMLFSVPRNIVMDMNNVTNDYVHDMELAIIFSQLLCVFAANEDKEKEKKRKNTNVI